MEILDLREKRDQFERELLQRTQGTLVTIRGNYPGEDKRDYHATMVVREMEKILQEKFPASFKEETNTKEGLMVYLMIEDNPERIKKTCIQLEDEHGLGRLADLDVRSQDKTWSREDFHHKRRKCYLCEKDAVICTRSQAHNRQDILDYFHITVEEFMI